MITEAEFIHKCEFTCPKCKAVIRPSEMVNTYEELLRKTEQGRADEIIADCMEDMQKHHFKLHSIEDMIKQEGIGDDEIKKLEKDIITAISIVRLEERFGNAKIEFGKH